ncbi:MAG: response regulator [Candidatus Aureabacteria bacterium]|nr:response regulator [Candidatus Auribacterota bacterium]
MRSSATGRSLSARPAVGRPRILVVDDEMGPRESLRMILKDQYELILVECGKEGVEKMKGGGIDLVLLDLKMKKMSGIEALEKMKEIDPSVSVVILTGYGTLDTAQRAIRLGAADYVSKPFDVVELTKTVRKILEKRSEGAEKEQMLEKLKTLNRNLEDQSTSFKKLISSQKLYSSFFHEICNPLTSILGYVQILLMELEKKKGFADEDRERAQKYLHIIENELDRCRLLFRSFTSNAKSGKEDTKPSSLKMVIEETFLLLRPQMELKGIRIKEEFDAPDSSVLLEDGQLKQVLLNLCINAMHAMGKGGTLSVSARQNAKGTVAIEVADTGCGMDEETLRKAWQPFYTTKDPATGSGLGLAISKGIVEKMGGSIGLESKKGVGTRVTITIPSQRTPSCDN